MGRKLTAKQKEELKELVARGKWNYVFSVGGRWGLFMFVFMWLFYEFILKEEYWIGLNLITWAIGGLIFGLFMWSQINKRLKNG